MPPVRRDLTIPIVLACNVWAHEFFVSNVWNTSVPTMYDVLDARNRQTVEDAECIFGIFSSITTFAKGVTQ